MPEPRRCKDCGVTLVYGKADHVRKGDGYQCVRCYQGLPRLRQPDRPVQPVAAAARRLNAGASMGRTSALAGAVALVEEGLVTTTLVPSRRRKQASVEINPRMVEPVPIDETVDFDIPDDLPVG